MSEARPGGEGQKASETGTGRIFVPGPRRDKESCLPPCLLISPGMLLGEAGGSLVDAPEFKLSFT